LTVSRFSVGASCGAGVDVGFADGKRLFAVGVVLAAVSAGVFAHAVNTIASNIATEIIRFISPPYLLFSSVVSVYHKIRRIASGFLAVIIKWKSAP
jgi:hypothetical protein